MKLNNQDQSNSDNAQIINDLNNIKSQMNAITPIDYQRLMGEIENLIASNINISSELLHSLESMKSTIENHGQNARTVQISNNDQATLENKDSKDSLNGFIENEIREKELITHKAEFQGFEKKFKQYLSDDNELLKKLADGLPLTKEEEKQLESSSSTKNEELSSYWKTTYQIIDKTLESIEYIEKQLKEIDKELDHPDTNKERSEQLLKSKATYQDGIEKHQDCLKNDMNPCIKARDEERQYLHNCIKNGEHEKVKHHIKAHCHKHIDHYTKEQSKDPNHKGLHEMCEIIKKSGLHEKDKDCRKHLHDIENHLEISETKQQTVQNSGMRYGLLAPDKTPVTPNRSAMGKPQNVINH